MNHQEAIRAITDGVDRLAVCVIEYQRGDRGHRRVVFDLFPDEKRGAAILEVWWEDYGHLHHLAIQKPPEIVPYALDSADTAILQTVVDVVREQPQREGYYSAYLCVSTARTIHTTIGG